MLKTLKLWIAIIALDAVSACAQNPHATMTSSTHDMHPKTDITTHHQNRSQKSQNPKVEIVLAHAAAPALTSSIKKKQNSFTLSDMAIRQMIIRRSRSSYAGRCGCPYDRTSRGHKCGRRSAYSRKRGAYVICYPSDIDQPMLTAFKVSL